MLSAINKTLRLPLELFPKPSSDWRVTVLFIYLFIWITCLGGGEGATQLRNIADQLEEALTGMQDGEENPNLNSSIQDGEENPNLNSSIQDGEENPNSSIQDGEENPYPISLNFDQDVIVLDQDTILDQVLDRDTDLNQDGALDQDAIIDIVTVINHNHS